MPAGQEMSSLTRTLKQLLDTYLAMPEVDKKRIYIVGLSMGAMGTYDLVVRYPEIFAAAVPICGIGESGPFAGCQRSEVPYISWGCR